MRRNGSVMITLALLLAGLFGIAAPSLGQGVTVGLMPQAQQVAPGALLHIDIALTQAGLPINGFDALIQFDPTALTPVPRAPVALQLGQLMTSACSNHFHLFGAGNETPMDTVTVVLLCAGVSVTGPGQLYSVDFQASMTPQITYVRFAPGLQFYNEGLYVGPITSSDTVIGIGMDPPSGVPPGSGLSGLRLDVAPNPTQGDAVLTIQTDRAGPQHLMVVDLLGRVVRRFADSITTPGVRTVSWDGHDTIGNRLPAGIYFVTLDIAGRSVSKRVLLIN